MIGNNMKYASLICFVLFSASGCGEVLEFAHVSTTSCSGGSCRTQQYRLQATTRNQPAQQIPVATGYVDSRARTENVRQNQIIQSQAQHNIYSQEQRVPPMSPEEFCNQDEQKQVLSQNTIFHENENDLTFDECITHRSCEKEVNETLSLRGHNNRRCTCAECDVVMKLQKDQKDKKLSQERAQEKYEVDCKQDNIKGSVWFDDRCMTIEEKNSISKKRDEITNQEKLLQKRAAQSAAAAAATQKQEQSQLPSH
jgi:hypothetical protein